MKQIYTLLLILCIGCLKLNAQTTDVITGLGVPVEIEFKGTELFIIEFNTFKVSKIDITDTTPTATDVLTSLSGNYGLEFNGNDLYIARTVAHNITKVSLPSQTLTTYAPGLNDPNDMLLIGNIMYISEYNEGTVNSGRISKIDITDATPTIITVASGLSGPTKMALNGDDLYISEEIGGKISKINITNTIPITPIDVVTGLSRPNGLVFYGNDLFVAQLAANKVSKIDVTTTTPVVTDVATGLGSPYGLELYGDDLYIAEPGANKISKLNLLTLSTNENVTKSQVKLYPSPADKFISISGGINYEMYDIYNFLGAKVISGSLNENQLIDVQNLASGSYFIKFENSKPIKFIKK